MYVATPAIASGCGGPALAVDGALRAPQLRPGTAPSGRDDLGGDGHRGLLRSTRADVETDRCVQPLEVGVGYAQFLQSFGAVVVRAPRSHRADVGDRRL